jgi:hypothetical protein
MRTNDIRLKFAEELKNLMYHTYIQGNAYVPPHFGKLIELASTALKQGRLSPSLSEITPATGSV